METIKAFTLIELLVVVLIIGILATVAVPLYEKAVEKSRAVQSITLARSWHDAQEIFYLENGYYAPSQQNLSVQITCPTDYTCDISNQKISIKYKNATWNIVYSHNNNTETAYAKGKLYCWDNSGSNKTVCSKLGTRWSGIDSNMYLLN